MIKRKLKQLSLIEPVLWLIFRGLNAIADFKQGVVQKVKPQVYFLEEKTANDPYIWIFCSTIGELNACKPLIKDISYNKKLVLLTDRECYKEAYRQHFPDAVVVLLSGHAGEGNVLLKELPPSEIVVCEIPCALHDAPCRLSYGLLRKAAIRGVKLSLVNGWLYHYDTSCKMDAIERCFFNRYYVRLFDLIVVQTDAVRTELLNFGACDEKVKIAENIKFDSLTDTDIQIKDKVSERIIHEFSSANYPVIVAGCITDIWEFELLLGAYFGVRKKHPEVRLVLAPRHPENTEQMLTLKELLVQATTDFCFKSELLLGALEEELDTVQILVLDTIGELRSYYSCANACYVGRDHNILEPLVFGKPVAVISDWNTTYPSYPVYKITKEKSLIQEVDDADSLAAIWDEMLFSSALDSESRIQKLIGLSGGVKKTKAYMAELKRNAS